jgi:hypothetical protein
MKRFADDIRPGDESGPVNRTYNVELVDSVVRITLS